MKKLLVVASIAGAAYYGYKKWSQQQAENDVWSQATDPVPPRDLR